MRLLRGPISGTEPVEDFQEIILSGGYSDYVDIASDIEGDGRADIIVGNDIYLSADLF